MDEETFEKVKKGYAAAGILLEKKVLMDGNIPHSECALTENNKRRVLNETQLLSDAKLRGFYQNPSITYDLLENFPENIDLQELKLTIPLKWTKEQFKFVFDGLTLKDVVARTATKNGRSIGLALSTTEMLVGTESKLFKEIKKYARHS